MNDRFHSQKLLVLSLTKAVRALDDGIFHVGVGLQVSRTATAKSLLCQSISLKRRCDLAFHIG